MLLSRACFADSQFELKAVQTTSRQRKKIQSILQGVDVLTGIVVCEWNLDHGSSFKTVFFRVCVCLFLYVFVQVMIINIRFKSLLSN